MKTRTWGIWAIVLGVVSVGLYLFFQNQSAVVYSAGEDVSAVDLGIKNGVGFGMAGTLISALIAAWKSGSPQKIIQTLCLIGLWATSFGNQAALTKVNELALILNEESPAPDPVAPIDTKAVADDLWSKLKGLLGTDAKQPSVVS